MAVGTPRHQCTDGAGMLNCIVESVGCAGPMGLVGGVLGDVENAGCDGPVAVGRRAPAGDDHVVCYTCAWRHINVIFYILLKMVE